MVLVGPGGKAQRLDAGDVHAGEGLEVHGVQLVADLGEPLVAAGLQLRGGHGDGPDAAGKELVDVEGVGAAGIESGAASRRTPWPSWRPWWWSGEEGLAAMYISSLGSSPAFTSTGEGVGELQAEFQTVGVRQSLEPGEHGHRVAVLQVLLEVVIVEGDIVIAHAVQNGAGGLIAQDGGVALDEGVQVLFLNEVAGDALDLVRRAAVEGGDRHGPGDMGVMVSI